MNRSIKILGMVGSLFAGSLALLGAGDASAGPYRRLGVGNCGSDGYAVFAGVAERTFECTIPSDGYLEQDSVLTASVYVAGGSYPSEAKACSVNPSSGFWSCPVGYEETTAGVVTLTGSELDGWNTASWFPYVQVHLAPMAVFTGIKLSS